MNCSAVKMLGHRFEPNFDMVRKEINTGYINEIYISQDRTILQKEPRSNRIDEIIKFKNLQVEMNSAVAPEMQYASREMSRLFDPLRVLSTLAYAYLLFTNYEPGMFPWMITYFAGLALINIVDKSRYDIPYILSYAPLLYIFRAVVSFENVPVLIPLTILFIAFFNILINKADRRSKRYAFFIFIVVWFLALI